MSEFKKEMETIKHTPNADFTYDTLYPIAITRVRAAEQFPF